MNALLDSLFKMLQKPAKLVILATFFAATAFSILTYLPDTDSGFFGVAGGLLIMLIMIAFWALVPTLLLLGKEDAARKVFPFILFYWLFNEICNYLSDASWIRPKVIGLRVSISVFELLIALTLIAAIVLIVLGMFVKSFDLGLLPYALAAGSLLFYFIDFILCLVAEIKYDADWGTYLESFISTLIVPIGIFFGVVYFFVSRQKAAKSA